MTSTLPAVTAPQVPAQRQPVPEVRSTSRTAPSKRPDLLLCGALLVAILTVQGWNIADYPTLSDAAILEHGDVAAVISIATSPIVTREPARIRVQSMPERVRFSPIEPGLMGCPSPRKASISSNE